MENISLTSKELKELEKNGFLVIPLISFKDYFRNIVYGFIITSIFSFIPMMLFMGSPYFYNIVIPILILGLSLLLYSTYYYVVSSKVFITEKGFTAFGKVNTSQEVLLKKVNQIFFFIRLYEKLDSVRLPGKGDLLSTLGMFGSFSVLVLWAWFLNTYLPITQESDFFRNILVLIFPFGLLSIITYLSNKLVNSIHPLYAFGNLGEKIQKLTPEIESQSKLIQSEFQRDMNFSVLHSGFEKLSGTFSRIVELVLKLEKIEARANKGNLFDSAKYIGSLRADIVTPLSELKKFLEGQRKQLLESQKELSRVRVGGDPETSSGGRENIELQSKRSESLLQELDANIAALDGMITKIG